MMRTRGGVKYDHLQNDDLYAAARRQGWRIKLTKNHIRLAPADPAQPLVITSRKSGSWHSRGNILRDMRRSGFVWPDQND